MCFPFHSVIKITDISCQYCTNQYFWGLVHIPKYTYLAIDMITGGKKTINTGLAHTSRPLVKDIYIFGEDLHCKQPVPGRRLLTETFKRTQQGSFVHFTLGPVTASPPPLLPKAQDDTQALTL